MSSPLVHTHYASVRVESSTWLNAFDVFEGLHLEKSRAKRTFMREGDFELFMALPYAGYEDLRFGSEEVHKSSDTLLRALNND